jgi:hypothetical protein
MIFSKYKEAEQVLQQSVTPLGYSVQIEPISALDLYYSDGSAASSYGKLVFSQGSSEFVVFFPDLFCFQCVPITLKERIQAWLKQLE